MRNLSLEENLIRSWEQIIHLGTELPSLEKLYLSSMPLEIPDNLEQMEEFQTYNGLNEILTIDSPKEVFKNMKTLVLIRMGLTWEKINRISPFFPNIQELVICHNECNDFENISEATFENFKNLKVLNLDDNKIVVKSPTNQQNEMTEVKSQNLDILSKFTVLTDLIVCNNEIHRFEDAEKLPNLDYLNLEQNGITSTEILVDLRNCKKLNSIRILKNPISDIHTNRHVRNIVVGEIRSLKNVNGTELSKYDRRDFEIYYLNHTFKEYFKLFNTNQEEYLESEFLEWANKTHPNALIFIKEYDNPFPQLKGQV